MRSLSRVAAVALLCIALSGVALGSPAHASAAPAASYSAAAPPIAIDLGGIFGDENEPDEDEPDEGGGQSAQSGTRGDSVSIPVVILAVVVAAAVGGYVAIRLRRTYLRVRGWGRDLWARL
jgi:hypothetical protein